MTRLKFEKNWPINDEYLLELGRLMSVWGNLEFYLTLSITHLMGYKEQYDLRPIILTAHSTFQQRCDALESLCELQMETEQEISKYKNAIAKTRAAQKGRNKYAHNSIGFDVETQQHKIGRITAKGTLKTDIEVVHLNDIREVTAKAHEAACLIHDLVKDSGRRPVWER